MLLLRPFWYLKHQNIDVVSRSKNFKAKRKFLTGIKLDKCLAVLTSVSRADLLQPPRDLLDLQSVPNVNNCEQCSECKQMQPRAEMRWISEHSDP